MSGCARDGVIDPLSPRAQREPCDSYGLLSRSHYSTLAEKPSKAKANEGILAGVKFLNLLATMRRRKKPWARRTLGAFVFVWLNLALQPCVMALGSEHQGDCPRCPPATSEQHALHDMASMEMPCATSADCTVLDDYNYDGRTNQSKVKDFQGDSFAVVPWALTEPGPEVSRPLRSSTTSNHHSGASPPLHIFYCVYLI